MSLCNTYPAPPHWVLDFPFQTSLRPLGSRAPGGNKWPAGVALSAFPTALEYTPWFASEGKPLCKQESRRSVRSLLISWPTLGAGPLQEAKYFFDSLLCARLPLCPVMLCLSLLTDTCHFLLSSVIVLSVTLIILTLVALFFIHQHHLDNCQATQ